jgi:acyl-CoA reductase-like NAD-dependent aldehyde dehydrogenase
VLNVVTGADAVVGPVVVGDPRVKHVAFTGSTAGGKRIMGMAAANVTNVTLELGGNDPAVVLDDAVMDEATIGKIAMATFMTTGQVCMALKRLYVPRSMYGDAVDGLRSFLEGQKLGSGLNPEVTMGPLNMRHQREYVEELLAESRAAGTEVIVAGEYADGDPGEGNYMLPALVLDPSADQRIVTEEQFGPALPVIPYDSLDEVVGAANDTWAGLCASVWSTDTEHAKSVGRQLRAGHVFFNNHNATAVDERAPFGGFGQSGLGRELGRDEGVLGFTETQVMAVPDGEPAHWSRFRRSTVPIGLRVGACARPPEAARTRACLTRRLHLFTEARTSNTFSDEPSPTSSCGRSRTSPSGRRRWPTPIRCGSCSCAPRRARSGWVR